jgi:4,5-DOPA dioxygenase extradiol
LAAPALRLGAVPAQAAQRPHRLGPLGVGSSDFDAWVADALARGDVDELAAYRHRAPGLPFAHPTPGHYTPLFIALGAAIDPERSVHTSIDGYMMGFSKRSFQTVG